MNMRIEVPQRALTALSITLLSTMLFAQSPVVINDPIYGGTMLPFNDTIVQIPIGTSTSPLEYGIDLDLDLMTDVKFDFHGFDGGFGGARRLRVTSYGGFELLVDTSYWSISQFIDQGGQIQDTLVQYTVIEQFTDGDTIPINAYSDPSQNVIIDRSWGNLPQLLFYDDVIHFVGDTSYIALYNTNTVPVSIYYLELFVDSGYNVELISAHGVGPMLGVYTPELTPATVGPNPCADRLFVDGEFDYLNVYGIMGRSIGTFKCDGQLTTINTSQWRSGLYTILIQYPAGSSAYRVLKE